MRPWGRPRACQLDYIPYVLGTSQCSSGGAGNVAEVGHVWIKVIRLLFLQPDPGQGGKMDRWSMDVFLATGNLGEIWGKCCVVSWTPLDGSITLCKMLVFPTCSHHVFTLKLYKQQFLVREYEKELRSKNIGSDVCEHSSEQTSSIHAVTVNNVINRYSLPSHYCTELFSHTTFLCLCVFILLYIPIASSSPPENKPLRELSWKTDKLKLSVCGHAIMFFLLW